jgi:conjugal transfer/entry exclusion protein
VEVSLADAKLVLDALAAIGRIESQINTLGVIVANAAQELTALKAQLADTSADVLAKLDQLTNQLGELPADAQATLDEIKAGVQTLDNAVGDADGSDTPPVTP